MVSAYILIQTEVGKAAQVTDQVRGISGVVAVDPAGPTTSSHGPNPTTLMGSPRERSCRCRSSTASRER